ncbi:hypothetical protein [Robertmurraya kyonggiensis]|uniref:Bacitracin ABC transporter ATP-binding protein n=1 Tax=Robertmurraya kyonggiensis TaxID=1037680 RepID=A0A4U1D174_9BACI|nr:hypothetical protein [Robertmurraya kyonggiensis]TKC14907.1 bacitracin ABC transporter ATP-binding protein [Robertmurraya kyonggiensis]
MLKDNEPLLSDEFLDELEKEINQLYGWNTVEPSEEKE